MGKTKKQKNILEETEERRFPLCGREGKGRQSCETFGELCGLWLQERYTEVKKSTYFNYHYCIYRHILPAFERSALRQLNGDEILTFIGRMREKGLADSTMNSVLITFRSVLRHGIRMGDLDDSLLQYCRMHCRRQESRILIHQDSLPMKEYLLGKNDIFSVGVLLCRGTGIRIGELCGLKWGDLDFSSNTFKIRRTISRIANPEHSDGQPKTVLYVRPPKSATSAREIPIPQYLADILRAMRKDGEFYLLTGSTVCTEPRNVQKRFKTILRHCKMQDCNFHAMRHGFATACLEQGIDCKTVSSILGHASTRTTMDFYAHTSLRQKENCINMIS